MNKLLKLLAELEKQIPHSGKSNQSISSAPAGWHIEHAVLTTNKIIKSLTNSNPREYKWKFNFKRIYVLTFNKIPRGRGKAPASVQPQGEFVASDCKNKIQLAINNVRKLTELNSHNYFLHPYFGKLKVASAIKFLKIHTKHHLEIINEIIKK